MTGFASAEIATGDCKLVWEVRSVNHRYLDPSFRLPDELRALEVQLRKHLGDVLKRGKVDCNLRLVHSNATVPETRVDEVALAQLLRLQASVIDACAAARSLSVAEILRWPGVVSEPVQQSESLAEPALAAFRQAVAGLREAREREGQRLVEILVGHLDATQALLTAVNAGLEQHAPAYRQRLLERLQRLDIDAAPERLEQELALIAQRVDVREEADRLRAHLAEIRDVLTRAEPVGRRLDFLMQELNREANTLASKVQDDELARRAVDLKVLIEQMREQVQNLE